VTRPSDSDSVGSQTWTVKLIVATAGLALLWGGRTILNRIEKLETSVEAHEKAISESRSRIERLSDKIDTHSHSQDPAIADLKRRIDRVEYPRPWETQQSKRSNP
jgi:hypothetical protein